MMSTIIIRTDPKLKAKAQEVAASLGLTLTAVINIYLREFVRTKSVAFISKDWAKNIEKYKAKKSRAS